MYNNILDVKGLKVGQAQNEDALTGCTVVICEKGATCGVDVRGAAPGTRETDLLDPVNTVQKVHAVVLSGGSAFGLESTCGVSQYLEERNIGFESGPCKVPIVVGAVLFDLAELKQGNYGAGCGASVGKLRGAEYITKSGIGSYSIKLENGIVVSALVAVNALGDVYENGEVIAGALNDNKTKCLNSYELMKQGVTKGGFSIDNTTIGIIATNAKLDKSQCKKISQMAHDGYARAIFPIHTPHDGDTIFTMATGEIETGADLTLIGSIAVEVMEKSILNAVKNAKQINGIPSYNELNHEILVK